MVLITSETSLDDAVVDVAVREAALRGSVLGVLSVAVERERPPADKAADENCESGFGDAATAADRAARIARRYDSRVPLEKCVLSTWDVDVIGGLLDRVTLVVADPRTLSLRRQHREEGVPGLPSRRLDRVLLLPHARGPFPRRAGTVHVGFRLGHDRPSLLRLAAEEAELRASELHVVCSGSTRRAASAGRDRRADARDVVAAVKDWSDVTCTVEFRAGHLGAALRRASAADDLVVLGAETDLDAMPCDLMIASDQVPDQLVRAALPHHPKHPVTSRALWDVM